MNAIVHRPIPRRGVIAGGAALLGGAVLRREVAAQDQLYVASGTGVNLKMMLDGDGQPTVPLRELFGFDSYYAQCVIEDNAERFPMDTFEMGKVVVEPAVNVVEFLPDAGTTQAANASGAVPATEVPAFQYIPLPGQTPSPKVPNTRAPSTRIR